MNRSHRCELLHCLGNPTACVLDQDVHVQRVKVSVHSSTSVSILCSNRYLCDVKRT